MKWSSKCDSVHRRNVKIRTTVERTRLVSSNHSVSYCEIFMTGHSCSTFMLLFIRLFIIFGSVLFL